MRYEKRTYQLTILVLAVALLFSVFPGLGFNRMKMDDMNIDEMRESFVSMKVDIVGDLISQGKYRCCLKKPCTYCLADGKDECDCLDDIVNGKHPCGECIGEILEGHGNPYLKEYFAEAIAEKTGEKEAIQRIIDEKYA